MEAADTIAQAEIPAPKPAEKSSPEAPKTPPASPAVVKKTPLQKTPREIQLEKELAATADRLSALESWKQELDKFLANMLPAPTSKKSSRAGEAELDRWFRGDF